MKVAFIGPDGGTSGQRAQALRRLGHTVTIIDPWSWLPRGRWVGPWVYRTGAIGAGLIYAKRMSAMIAQAKPEFVWVDQGDWLDDRMVKAIRHATKPDTPLVNYMHDDPFGGRDGLRFSGYLSALKDYDLVCVVREENLAEAAERGARRVKRIWRNADEVAHAPIQPTPEQRSRFASEVAFVGTWMPERGPFMAELIGFGVPLSIWGNLWERAKEWPVLSAYWRGPALDDSYEDYAAAILSAKINLGLLSKGNRDLHTTRSLEIPALGGLLCAERTTEHLRLYEEGHEAIFWDDAAECAAQCKALLKNESRRHAIAAAGHQRALRNGHYNEQMMSTVISSALEITGS